MKNQTRFNRHPKRAGGKIRFAVLLVLMGSILLAFNLGVIPIIYKSIIISWQMLLIVLGVLCFSKCEAIKGTVLISVGTFFILPTIAQSFPGLLNGMLDNTHNYWPVLLIIAGVLFLFKKNEHHKEGKYKFISSTSQKDSESGTEAANDYIDRSVMFNGSEEIVFSSNFKGGETNVAFGEIKLDLRKVSGLNKNNKLELNVMFGSIAVYVPNDWQINLNSSTLLGDVQDKRHFIDIPLNEDTALLNLKASSMFGSIEIRN